MIQGEEATISIWVWIIIAYLWSVWWTYKPLLKGFQKMEHESFLTNEVLAKALSIVPVFNVFFVIQNRIDDWKQKRSKEKLKKLIEGKNGVSLQSIADRLRVEGDIENTDRMQELTDSIKEYYNTKE